MMTAIAVPGDTEGVACSTDPSRHDAELPSLRRRGHSSAERLTSAEGGVLRTFSGASASQQSGMSRIAGSCGDAMWFMRYLPRMDGRACGTRPSPAGPRPPEPSLAPAPAAARPARGSRRQVGGGIPEGHQGRDEAKPAQCCGRASQISLCFRWSSWSAGSCKRRSCRL